MVRPELNENRTFELRLCHKLSALGIFLFSLILFLVYIQIPTTQNFDEFHYVPSAKQFLEGKKNQNWEHPPLGKLIIAAGIAVFGDKPFGWRFSSALFGALTAVALFMWGGILFRSFHAAWLVVGFTWVNHLLYVQSRIAMLDSSMIFFLIAFVALFHSFWNFKEKPHLRMILMGVSLGAAAAIKWYSIAVGAGFFLILLLVKLGTYWGVTFKKQVTQSPATQSKGKYEENDQEKDEDKFFHSEMFKYWSYKTIAFGFFIIPALVYFASYIPTFLIQEEGLRFVDLFTSVQKRMLEGQLNVVNPHPYMSRWYEWPFLNRPIWYLFDKVSANEVRGVLLLGNPWMMWVGILSIFGIAIHFIKTRSRISFQILSTYLIFFGVWIVIPRKIAFYYYYYPAAIILSAAIVHGFKIIDQTLHATSSTLFKTFIPKDRQSLYRHLPVWCFLMICLFTFIYFFPILSGMKIPENEYLKYTWFRRWI